MTDHNETPLGTAFTVSIEAREGVSTGISAHDRARTIQVAIDPGSMPHDLVQPGHVFPLRAKPGRRPAARRPDRGGRRPRAARGPDPGRRRLRDHERRRDDGARARPHGVLRAPRAEDGHGRRPHRVPAAHREARRARRLGPAPDRVRRVPGGRVPRAPDRQAARRAREGRRRGRGERPRPRALRVPDRRRLPLAPLRLRRAARAGARPRSRPRGAASSCTWARRVAGSGS